MSTLTEIEQDKIRDFLHDRHIPAGIGTAEAACSIASINLALTGRLTDAIPDCMSFVIGRWIIGIQDAMPDAMRNSEKWKDLLPLAAGTGRLHEKERLNIILDWMWGEVLPLVQPVADKHGFGAEWSHMCRERSSQAARAAARAAREAAWAAAAARAARAAARAVEAAWAAEAWAAEAVAWAAEAARAAAWEKIDPPALLARLVAEPV